MRSVCIGCWNEGGDKNACIPDCSKIQDFQKNTAGIIVGNPSAYECMVSYMGMGSGHAVPPKPPHY